MTYQYLLLFIVGGIIMVLIKHMTTHMSPNIGAIVATLPIGLFSGYFILTQKNMSDYLSSYSKQSVINILISIIYLSLLKKNYFTHSIIFSISLILWISFSIVLNLIF